MSRLIYAGWMLVGLVFFALALMFVLANQGPVSLNVLFPGSLIEARLGMLVLVVFIVGALLGLLSGLGVRALLKMAGR